MNRHQSGYARRRPSLSLGLEIWRSSLFELLPHCCGKISDQGHMIEDRLTLIHNFRIQILQSGRRHEAKNVKRLVTLYPQS